MVLAEHAKDLLRLGRLGERGESAQVTEQRGDLAPMPGEERLALIARQHARHLRGESRQLGALQLDRLEQTRVLDGQGCLIGEGADERDLPVAERSNVHPPQTDDADREPVPKQRHAEQSPIAADLLHLPQRVLRVGVHIDDVHGATLEERPASHRSAVRHVVDGFFRLAIAGVEVENGRDAINVSHWIVADDVAVVGVTQRHGTGDDGIEHVLQVKRRAAHRLQHVTDGRLPLHRLMLLPHQARQAHGDAGLSREDGNGRDLLVVERVDAVPPEAHHADDVVVHDDRQPQDRPVPGQALTLPPAVLRVGQNVVDVDRASLEGHAPNAGFGAGRDRVLAFVAADFGGHTTVRHQSEQRAVSQVDVARIGRAELCRPFCDLLKDRRELEATMDDGMQNFADGRQRFRAGVSRVGRCAGSVLGLKRFGQARAPWEGSSEP